jgi:GxxExxY protein
VYLTHVVTKMHPNFTKAAGLTSHIIGAAIEVHRDKGPGLIESIYEWCLEKELELCRLSSVSQKVVTVTYKGFAREEPLRFDVLVEAKAVAELLPIHKAQLMSYLKLLNVPVGLLINFNELKLTDGVHRLILPGSNR